MPKSKNEVKTCGLVRQFDVFQRVSFVYDVFFFFCGVLYLVFSVALIHRVISGIFFHVSVTIFCFHAVLFKKKKQNDVQMFL